MNLREDVYETMHGAMTPVPSPFPDAGWSFDVGGGRELAVAVSTLLETLAHRRSCWPSASRRTASPRSRTCATGSSRCSSITASGRSLWSQTASPRSRSMRSSEVAMGRLSRRWPRASATASGSWTPTASSWPRCALTTICNPRPSTGVLRLRRAAGDDRHPQPAPLPRAPARLPGQAPRVRLAPPRPKAARPPARRLADMDLEWYSAGAIIATLLGERYAFVAGSLGSSTTLGLLPPARDTFEGALQEATPGCGCCAATTPKRAAGSSHPSTTGDCGSRATGCCGRRCCVTVASPAIGLA